MQTSRTNWKFETNQLTVSLNALRESGAEIIDLSESNPTKCQFQYLTNNLLAPLSNPNNLKYEPHPRGLPDARRAVQHYYQEKGISVNLDNIFLTASTSEAYSLLFRLLVNSGERVLVPRPSYPLFDFLADLNDLELVPYSLRYDGTAWRIDIENLIAQCDAKTKAIILVHPNNPTGSFIKKSELREIVQIAKDKSLALISDEVFSDYAFSENGERVVSLAETDAVPSFTLSGISKVLGLPQMKLGWIAANGPQNLIQPLLERLELILDTYLSVSTPIQNALPGWFSLRSGIQKEIKERVQTNLSFLQEMGTGLRPVPISLLQPEGGWYTAIRLPDTKSEEEWALEFLKKDRVYVHPGYFFDFADEPYAILSLLPSPEVFKEGIARLTARIG